MLNQGWGQAANTTISGSSISLAPTPTEGISQRLLNIAGLVSECHQIVGEIENTLGVFMPPSGQAAEKAAPPQGVNGVTLEMRNALFGLRERLNNIAAGVR